MHLKSVFIIPNPSTLSFPTCFSNWLLCCNVRNDAGSTKINLSLILPHSRCQFYLFIRLYSILLFILENIRATLWDHCNILFPNFQQSHASTSTTNKQSTNTHPLMFASGTSGIQRHIQVLLNSFG